MLKKLFYLLFKLKKWKLNTPPPPEAFNCIMVAAPHTSNWDFVYSITALAQLKLKPRFTIKKELKKFPLGALIDPLGALWIDRSPSKDKRLSMTDVMVNLFKNAQKPLCMVVTVEGTRARTTKWKTGFYYAALEAKVPICLAYMDYEKRETGVGMCFMPTGDIKADMKIVMDFYKGRKGKHPENFALDERYA
ncbi:acyltransferase [Fulvivirga sp. RKSG066]|uniref:1-acyl-sn-glycerol-3-phosphate acyltransferase n=1 Tax=Fulvivirga aurantia TaxID=2529383 RepID=UPI0012BC168F|nr:1-acyl-sn-glycerol-3-phosphate acyltransferase [Fulvivirga aurantia]MTI20980.1 acyltransferase [Fulvivirga aurantia]